MALKDAPRCTAKSKSSGERCKNPAVTGFSVCRLHGAGNRNKGKVGGRPIVTGRYSKHLPLSIADKIENFKSGDPLDLLDELATQRALISEYMSVNAVLSPDDTQRLLAWLEAVGKMAERVMKMRNDTALTAVEIQYIKARAVDVAIRYFDDPDTRRQFITDLFEVRDTDSRSRHPALIAGSGIGTEDD